MHSLIAADDYVVLWAIIATGTGLAIWLEQNYKWAARLSGPVIALLIAMVLSNTRVVPAESPAYDFVTDWLVPLAIPLLLFRANIRQIVAASGRMFVVFHISSIGTLIGTVLAFYALRGRIGSPDTEHAAGMMAASYIGGAVNFMAIKTTYNAGESASKLIVADNFVMAAIFVLLLTFAASRWFRKHYLHPHSTDADGAAATNLAAAHWQRKGIALMDIAWSFAFAFTAFALATVVGRVTKSAFGAPASATSWLMQMLGVLCTNKFVLLTTMTLVLATLLAKPLEKVNGPEEFGSYLLSLFLFTIGLPADLMSVLTQAPLYFVFCGIIATTNLAFTLGLGRLLRFNLEELLLAVNANLGGAPSAAAMAISAGWPRLVLPGILVGIWGYVIGTPIGVMVVELFKKQ
jgi:uncharacterized membrane protein